MLEIYYGEAKGKTRLCIGAAGTAALRDKNVLLVGFAENESYERLSGISPYITCPVPQQNTGMREYFDHAVRMALTFQYAMLILDGVFDAVAQGQLSAAEVYEFLSNAPDSIEIICTGQSAGEKFLAIADEVVEMSSGGKQAG